MAAYRDILVRAVLRGDCIERVKTLLSAGEWSAIAEESPLCHKIASEDDSKWIPFIDHSGFGGAQLKDGIFSFRCTLVHRANELLDSFSEWLTEVSIGWEMVSTSDYIDDGFFVSTMAKPDRDFVGIPLAGGEKGPVAYNVSDFRPQDREWRPEEVMGPLGHSMLPVDELGHASANKGAWLLLGKDKKVAVKLIANGYMESAKHRRAKYRT